MTDEKAFRLTRRGVLTAEVAAGLAVPLPVRLDGGEATAAPEKSATIGPDNPFPRGGYA
jgi:hypothetical protein